MDNPIFKNPTHKIMTDKKDIPQVEENDTVQNIAGIWEQYGKKAIIGLAVIVVVVGGYFGYKTLVSAPNEKKANEAIFQAEAYFRIDSLGLALNGDNINPGFLKVISKYGGTEAANMAHFYAGSCYLKLGDFNNAVKQLEAFSTKEPIVAARAKALTADALSESGKKEDAAKLYKDAGTLFDKDEANSPQYLFRAGYLYESMGKTKDAIEMYKLIKEKYPQFREYDVDKYLGRLGSAE
jgi:tetratricopeptide (TPR) repeat protein